MLSVKCEVLTVILLVSEVPCSLYNTLQFKKLHLIFVDLLLASRCKLLLDLISWKPTFSLYAGSNHSMCSKRAGLIHAYLPCALSLTNSHPQLN